MVKVGINYHFMPEVSDPDSDPLTFSITNKPNWASYDSLAGELSGVAFLGSVGSYNDIVITVSDGKVSVDLPPFSVTVEPTTTANMPPEISGNAPTSVAAGNNYSFSPTASDPDGDALTFSIQNKPAWAAFHSSNGQLTGIPSQNDVGVYANIEILVTDGQLTTSLPTFSLDVLAVTLGSVTLSWTPPTQNTDGSALTDLAAYKFYYGLSQGNYPNSVRVDNPGITTFVVENLPMNTYFFVATAINSSGIESDFSNVAFKTMSQ